MPGKKLAIINDLTKLTKDFHKHKNPYHTFLGLDHQGHSSLNDLLLPNSQLLANVVGYS